MSAAVIVMAPPPNGFTSFSRSAFAISASLALSGSEAIALACAMSSGSPSSNRSPIDTPALKNTSDACS